MSFFRLYRELDCTKFVVSTRERFETSGHLSVKLISIRTELDPVLACARSLIYRNSAVICIRVESAPQIIRSWPPRIIPAIRASVRSAGAWARKYRVKYVEMSNTDAQTHTYPSRTVSVGEKRSDGGREKERQTETDSKEEKKR